MLVIDLCQSRSIATSAYGIKTQVLLDSFHFPLVEQTLSNPHIQARHLGLLRHFHPDFLGLSLSFLVVRDHQAWTKNDQRISVLLWHQNYSYGAFRSSKNLAGILQWKRISCFWLELVFQVQPWPDSDWSLRCSCWISWWQSWTVHTKPSSKFLG